MQSQVFDSSTSLANDIASHISLQSHILVVDDEEINRLVIINLLSSKGYRISECTCGEEAMDFLKATYDTPDQVDLVLLDVMLPNITGYDVCTHLRKQKSSNQLPILFLTSKTQVDDLAKGYEVGGNDFLTKPVDKRELFARVDMQLELLKSHRQLHENLSQLKQMQSQLVHAEKMSGLSTLVAGMAHEINNPTNMTVAGTYNLDEQLHRLQQFINSLLEEDDSDISAAFQKRFNELFLALDTMREGSSRMQKLVEGFRLFSHLDEMDYQHCHLSSDVQACLDIVKATYCDQIDFVCTIDDDPEIQAHAAQLNQVFMNVMINACQGVLDKWRGKTDTEGKGKISIRLFQEGDFVIVQITDNGVGISDENAGKIFEPFFTTRAVGEGTGLGLAIAFGIVEEHKGSIDVCSQETQGTQVTIYLPLKDDTL